MSRSFIIHFKLKTNHNNKLICEMRVLLARKCFRTEFFKLLIALLQKILTSKAKKIILCEKLESFHELFLSNCLQ